MTTSLLAEISAAALSANLEQLRVALPPATRLFPVVKADAYGHGLDQVLPVLAPHVDGLAVATQEEAVHLRERGFARPVLVFFSPYALDRGERLEEVLATLVRHDVTLTVTSQREADLLASSASSVGRRARVHLKIDTGMNRSGARWEEAPALLADLRARGDLAVTGAYTHFASAEDDLEFTRVQLGRFLRAVDDGGGRSGLVLHAANSAALLALSESHLDLVRPGLALYGYHAARGVRPPLAPALRLTARLMQVKAVAAGEACGYGLTYVFERPATVGLVPIGYADGYLRALGNRALMAVRGRPVPVRGRVAMDQVVVELTGVEGAEVGDPVEVIAPDPAAPHGVESLAKIAGTIPYELLCRFGPRIERRLVERFEPL